MAVEGIRFDAEVDLSDLRQDLETIRDEIADAVSEINDMADNFSDASNDADDVESETESIRDNLERIPDLDIATDVDPARREFNQVEERIDDLDGREINVDTDVDVDRAGRVGRGVGEVVGKTGIVEEDFGRDLGEAGGRLAAAFGGTTATTVAAGAAIGGVVAAAATAAAGLAGAGGLAVKALKLADEFEEAASAEVTAGIAELKTGVKNLKKQFVSEMSPLLANEVIPALKSLAKEFQKTIPSLVEFAETWVPSLIEGTRGWVEMLPNIIAGIEALMAVFAALYDASDYVVAGMARSLVVAIDGLVRVFQEMAKAGVEFIDMIPGIDFEDDLLSEIEDWDNPLEGAEEAIQDRMERSFDEFVENASLAAEAALQSIGTIDTAGEGDGVEEGLFEPFREQRDIEQGEEVEAAPLEVVPSPGLKELLSQAGLETQQQGDGGGNGAGQFAKGIAESLTDLPGINAEVDKLSEKLRDSQSASQLAAQGLRTLSTIGGQAISQLASTFGKGIGKVIAGTQGFEDLGKQLLKQIASLMQTIASALISIGSAMAIVPGFQGPASLYIAGGTALMAAASALSASVSSDSGGGSGGDTSQSDTLGIASLDGGGLVTADGLAMLHSNEVVRDADVDRDMMQRGGGGGGGTLEAVVSGEQLRFVLEENARRNNKSGI